MEKWDEEATKQIRTNWPTNYRTSDILWNKRREFSRECALRPAKLCPRIWPWVVVVVHDRAKGWIFHPVGPGHGGSW